MSDTIITADAKMREILTIAENVASSRATVLIKGESGTGKELVARLIHRKSSRMSKRFVAINCAAVPEGLLESELFGFEKGAFTGATMSKPGKFELASDGTLLLDEMSEMALHLQGKLLRAIQEGEIERLGGRGPIKVNVRIIATTNRDLKEMVKNGQFREDLYYRLNVIPLEIPPLRQRLKDIELLTKHFIGVSCLINGKNVKDISDAALRKLKGASWPGNIRELENTIERAVLLAKSETIHEDDFPSLTSAQSSTIYDLSPGMTVSDAEKFLILRTLDYTSQNRTQAAKMLGISIRTLRNKIQEYKLTGEL
ncbi:MAG: sigma-54 interaction domain-containing protein [Bdellovibrionales bacterium]